MDVQKLLKERVSQIKSKWKDKVTPSDTKTKTIPGERQYDTLSVTHWFIQKFGVMKRGEVSHNKQTTVM